MKRTSPSALALLPFLLVYLGLLGLAAPLPSAAPAGAAQDEAALDLEARIVAKVDDAEPALIQELAELRSQPALDALLRIYDLMSSVFMRQMVLEGLRLYDEVPGLERIALQHMTDVATQAQDRELRERAVDLIASCNNYGKAFLVMIVESSADDAIRVRAMQHHVGRVRDEDLPWYRAIFRPTEEEKAKARKGKEVEEKVPYQLGELRRLAFEALAPSLTKEELVEALEDKSREVRLRALEELDTRDDPAALELAEELYEQGEALPADRLAAARILARRQGGDVAPRFIDDGGKANTPDELLHGLADLLVEMDDPQANKLLLRQAGKGKGAKLLFSVLASRHIQDPKLDKTLIKLLEEDEPAVRSAAIDALVERRCKDALPALEDVVAEAEEPLVVRDAVQAITSLRGDDPAWTARLVELAKGDALDLRNAALSAIGRTRNPEHLPLLVDALQSEQWSTRLTAAQALETMGQREGVGALAKRMEHEVGRMAVEMSDILWRLTGQPFRTNGKLWAKWWEDQGESFQIISGSELRKLEKEEELRRLRQTSRTPSQFFGIKIISQRVIFVLDISGSMNDPTRGKFVGERGEPRIEVAKRELANALDSLDRNSLFNVITFSSEVASWMDRISELTPATLQEAKDYVGRLGAFGGTNIHGALRFAFDDPDVDTIYFLSDGEPSVGDVIDPHAIRLEVQRWRENRDVTIHAIAVGGSLKLLEWLAEDSGGKYVDIP